MSFDEWCAIQGVLGDDKDAFRVWLGNVAGTRMSEANWLKFFASWVRSERK